jgi:hypothetical protein
VFSHKNNSTHVVGGIGITKRTFISAVFAVDCASVTKVIVYKNRLFIVLSFDLQLDVVLIRNYSKVEEKEIAKQFPTERREFKIK